MGATAKRLLWADLIRIVAIYCVILIHLCALIVIPWEKFGTVSWWTAHIYSSLSLVAVPFLALLSGALLLTKVESIQTFYEKRFVKIIIPWIFWVIFTLFVDTFIFHKISVHLLGSLHTWWQYLRTAYWFMPALMQLYILTPAIRIVFVKVPLAWMLCTGLLVQLLISAQYSYCTLSVQCQPLWLFSGVEYLGYFLIGGVIGGMDGSKDNNIQVAVVFLSPIIQKVLHSIKLLILVGVWCISFLWIVFGTYDLSLAQQGFSAKLYHYTSLPVALASICSFIFLKNYFEYFSSLKQCHIHNYRKIITELSTNSFSIFFIHGVVLTTLLYFLGNNFVSVLLFASWCTIPILSIFLFLFSFVVVRLLQKIIFLKYIV